MNFKKITLAITCGLMMNGAALAAPAKPDVKIGVENWLQADVNQWTFVNTNQIIPSATVSRDFTPVADFESASTSMSDLEFVGKVDNKQQTIAINDYLEHTRTDALIVIHKGKIAYEQYFNDVEDKQRHILMSVTKSFIGTVVTELISQGKLDEQATIGSIVAPLKGTPVGKTTLRQVLDMTAGMAYSEDYADPNADVWAYISSIGLMPIPEGSTAPTSIMDYLKDMQVSTPAGEQFNYVTPMSEVLQAVIVAATGQQFNEVLSDMIWSKIGAERDGSILVESTQQALAGTGLMLTARDMARFGQMILNDGYFNGQQILSTKTTDDIKKSGDVSKFAHYAEENAMQGFSYGNQFWHTGNENNAFTAMGVFGQYIYIDPTAEVIIVKQSSDVAPLTPYAAKNDFIALDAIANHFNKK
ncbi:serine hydrolase domain-containing protein [Vibrio amylolyticus]|uniref:serine hydrolase domain-containing protein n=1 Tax=Vibrio amylolyticus TaxID=2847292 RepID=UPI00354AF535